MGQIHYEGKGIPHRPNYRLMGKRKAVCGVFLSRYERKIFLHRVVNGDEKWIYFGNPKRKKAWFDPEEPSTSTARVNSLRKKSMRCIWCDQKGVVYNELLKPGETVNTVRYRQQMTSLNNA